MTKRHVSLGEIDMDLVRKKAEERRAKKEPEHPDQPRTLPTWQNLGDDDDDAGGGDDE